MTIELPQHATLNSDHSVSYKLIYPVDVNGATLSQLNIRRPRVQDSIDRDLWKQQGKSSLSIDIHYFSNLTGQAPEVVSKLDTLDYIALGEVLTFLSRPQRQHRPAKAVGVGTGTLEPHPPERCITDARK
ncbi:MAG: phage tail assembly protein [Vampirovibrionales bacterium]